MSAPYIHPVQNFLNSPELRGEPPFAIGKSMHTYLARHVKEETKLVGAHIYEHSPCPKHEK